MSDSVSLIEQACLVAKEQHKLTKTENTIVSLIAQGYSVNEIADLRCRSIETVRTQVKSVKEKMQIPRTNLIPAAIKQYMHAE